MTQHRSPVHLPGEAHGIALCGRLPGSTTAAGVYFDESLGARLIDPQGTPIDHGCKGCIAVAVRHSLAIWRRAQESLTHE